jgi:hypothetical protein
MNQQKSCTKCKATKEITEFYARSNGSVEAICKPCKLLQVEQYRNTPQGMVSELWGSAKRRCEKNGVPFSLAKEDILIPKSCPVFPWIKLKRGSANGKIQSPNSPSLDRIDPNPKIGYVSHNVKVISWRANEIKKDASFREIEALYFYMKAEREGVSQKITKKIFAPLAIIKNFLLRLF